MLLQFSVENFKSFKEKAVLSLEGSADRSLPNNYVEVGKEKFLKTAAVFGSNAAGKSNLFQALTAAILTLRQSSARQVNEPLIHIVPFKFDDETINKPTSFEYVFVASDSKKYVYGFSATRKEIVEEYLYVYNTSKPTTVFERKGDTYFFTDPARKRDMDPLTLRNTSNKLFLSTATAWNCKHTIIPYTWLESGINTYSTDFKLLLKQIVPMFENDNDDSLREFINNLLHEADISIDDYESDIKDQTPEEFTQNIPPELRPLLSTVSTNNHKKITFTTKHTVEKDGKEKQYHLSLAEESQGTTDLFLFAPILKKAFETGETLFIDEFDKSIHPMLIEFIMSLFNNPEINKGNAQLVITTHTLSLMTLKLFRRDQIYFVEKDRKTGASDLYSLDDFSPRKSDDIKKAYSLGRYGAIPLIFSEAAVWG